MEMRSPRKEPSGVTASSFQAQASRQLAPFLCSNRDMSFNSGVSQPAALHPGHYSGAHDPISIGFYNVGLQNNFVALCNKETGWNTPAHCYKFTEALEHDLKKTFWPVIGLDALFLCELGSMEKRKNYRQSLLPTHAAPQRCFTTCCSPILRSCCDLGRLPRHDVAALGHGGLHRILPPPLMRASYDQKSFGYAANHVEYQFRRRINKDLHTRTS